MEPRWRKNWSDTENTHMRYLGGTGKCDIWNYEDGHPANYDLRLVWGDGTERWHWVHYEDGVLFLNAGSREDLKDAPTEEELEEATAYIRLFAPDIFMLMEQDDGA